MKKQNKTLFIIGFISILLYIIFFSFADQADLFTVSPTYGGSGSSEQSLATLATFNIGNDNNCDEGDWDFCYENSYTYEYENNACPATARTRVLAEHDLNGEEILRFQDGKPVFDQDVTISYRCDRGDEGYVYFGEARSCDEYGCFGSDDGVIGSYTFENPDSNGLPAITIQCWDSRTETCSDGAYSTAWSESHITFDAMDIILVEEGDPDYGLDSDGDGVPDSIDVCPAVFGSMSNGCPESNGEGNNTGEDNSTNNGEVDEMSGNNTTYVLLIAAIVLVAYILFFNNNK